MSEKILNGYYLPDSLSYLEDKLEFRELAVDDFVVKVPKISKEHILEIVSVLKKNRDEFLSTITIDEVAETYDRVSKKWSDKEYQHKKIAMELLPKLTNLSPELIEFFQFSTLYKIFQAFHLPFSYPFFPIKIEFLATPDIQLNFFQAIQYFHLQIFLPLL